MKDSVFTILAENCYDYGHTVYTNGDFDEALPYLEMAYAYRKEDPETLYFLARTYHRLGMYDKAIPVYTDLVENYPNIISLAKVARQDELEKEIKEELEPQDGQQMVLK